jgi:hypothetical protein
MLKLIAIKNVTHLYIGFYELFRGGIQKEYCDHASNEDY